MNKPYHIAIQDFGERVKEATLKATMKRQRSKEVVEEAYEALSDCEDSEKAKAQGILLSKFIDCLTIYANQGISQVVFSFAPPKFLIHFTALNRLKYVVGEAHFCIIWEDVK